MKYRIIEEERADGFKYYIVQRKYFFFWVEVCKRYKLSDAKGVINSCKATDLRRKITKKTIVP